MAIECDELDHRDRDIEYEVGQQRHIERLLGSTFLRSNPDVKDFCILGVVNKIFVQIKIECLGRLFFEKKIVASITGYKNIMMGFYIKINNELAGARNYKKDGL